METFLWIVTAPLTWILIGVAAFVLLLQTQVRVEVPKVPKLPKLREVYVSVLFLVFGPILAGALWFYLIDIIAAVHAMVGRLRALANGAGSSEAIAQVLSNLAGAAAVLLGVMAAAATLFFTLLRTWINERTTRATEEGLITDRINAAVASLGAEKTIKRDEAEETVPNIEVRIGAILALERMGRQNPDIHIQIMEILCAFVRENAKRPKDYDEENPLPPRHDVQFALTVIGRRDTRLIAIEVDAGYRIDLRGCHLARADLQRANLERVLLKDANLHVAELEGANLQGADVRRADLHGADLHDADLQGAVLAGAKLQGAHLWRANLQRAFLRDAVLQGAHLWSADLQRADLWAADLQRADLTGSHLQWANLADANLQRASLANADLLGVNLTRADLRGAYLLDAELRWAQFPTKTLLRGALVKNCDFTDVDINSKELAEVFGDGSVIIDEDRRPKHWPTENLEFDGNLVGTSPYAVEYQKWLANPDAYVPPQDRD